jgi:hypothetical protein
MDTVEKANLFGITLPKIVGLYAPQFDITFLKLWACPDSNRGPPPCEGGIIATRLQAQKQRKENNHSF